MEIWHSVSASGHHMTWLNIAYGDWLWFNFILPSSRVWTTLFHIFHIYVKIPIEPYICSHINVLIMMINGDISSTCCHLGSAVQVASFYLVAKVRLLKTVMVKVQATEKAGWQKPSISFRLSTCLPSPPSFLPISGKTCQPPAWHSSPQSVTSAVLKPLSKVIRDRFRSPPCRSSGLVSHPVSLFPSTAKSLGYIGLPLTSISFPAHFCEA